MRLSILKWPVVIILLLHVVTAGAQSGILSFIDRHSQPAAKITVVDPNEDNYDIHYVKLELTLSNLNTTFSGTATTQATVVAPSMPAYYFELDTTYTIDSCLVNGILYPVITTDSSLRKVQLSTALTAGVSFTARVVYHGTGLRGIYSDTASGTAVTFTKSQPYGSSGWWPCKQSLRDKIDSTDVWLTVPDTLQTGSNGVLQHITSLPGSKNRQEWHNNKPIDYYLVSATTGNYLEHSYYMHFTGSTDSMLIKNYYYKNQPNLPATLACLDSVGGMINLYSSLFGRYPFWQQKYGHCEVPGGPYGISVENQTMTTISVYDPWLVAHELGHQWFGDNVTCGTWKDIWLNEGCANYLAYLYEEKVEGIAIAKADMVNMHTSVVSSFNDSSMTYLADTAHLFGQDYALIDIEIKSIYNKGASVLHMLRFLGNNDSLFFTAMKQYQQQFAGGNAVTADMQSVFEQVYNQNLDTFFNQWIYSAGHPVIRSYWNQSGGQVFFKLKQTATAPASVSVFSTPVEVKLKSTLGDTTLRVYFNQAEQQYQAFFANPVNGLEIDPNGWLLARIYNSLQDTTLAIGTAAGPTPATVYPNPTANIWTLANIPTRTTLSLLDANGNTVWHGVTTASSEVVVPAKQLPPAVYYLHLQPAQGAVQTLKLIKQ